MSRPAPTLTILATTDLHGERAPELIPLAARAPGAALLLDNGDAFGGPAGLRFGLEGGTCHTVAWMNALGLTAMNIGNHDLDPGLEGLRARADQARFPMLSANLLDGDERVLPDRAVVETPAGRVGVTGAITPLARVMWSPSLRERLRITDPVEALARSCAALRADCAFVIALGHFGFPLGVEPPEENPGPELLERLSAPGADGRPPADCVVLGHTHVEHAEVRGCTAVLMPGRRAEAVGRAVLGGEAPSAELLPLPGDAATRLEALDGPRLEQLEAERAMLAPLLGGDLPGADRPSFGDQILAAARRRGADGIVIARRVGPEQPAARTVGEAFLRSPMLEPFVLLRLSAEALKRTLAVRDRHAELAESVTDPHAARRHRWHAFVLLGGVDAAPEHRLLVPCSWTGGYAGYDEFARAEVLAEPRAHLVELLA